MNNEKFWYAFEVTVDAPAAEAVEFAFNELGADGTEINNLGAVQTSETLTVIGYFQKPLDDEATVNDAILEALRIYNFSTDAIRETRSRRIGNVDWLFEWKKHWRATVAGKFIVAPTWEEIETTDKIIVRIEPSMAFGTGTHETTQLCLRRVGENYESGMSFLDVGTGTGILTVAAALLDDKNSRFLGYDTDFDSVTIARENAVLNEVENRIEFRVGSISASDDVYDFVCANITVDIIIPLLPLLLEKSKRILVLSGILREQESLIVSELEKREIKNAEIERAGEWISVLIKF